jgi:predicted dehydrogenase
LVGVVEPDTERREVLAKEHNIPQDMQFKNIEELLERDVLADGVIIATQDNYHSEPAIKCLEKGYHVLCEKPMALTPQECIQMKEASVKSGKALMLAHGLRYTPLYTKVKELLDNGEIGKIMSIQHTENVGTNLMTHAYVRGSWRNTAFAAPMIMAKCCHDMDILSWITGKKCKSIYSQGFLTFFKEENAPKNSSDRCVTCEVEADCDFSAIKRYVIPGPVDSKFEDDMVKLVSFVIGSGEDSSVEARLKALATGPFGRCAFRCDNNVVDHQVATITFEDDITVAFTMCGFTKNNDRTFKIFGTAGEMNCSLANNIIKVLKYNGAQNVYYPEHKPGGHHGSDTVLMESFVDFLRDTQNTVNLKTTVEASLQSHMMAFAAEESRLTGKAIDLSEFEKSFSNP